MFTLDKSDLVNMGRKFLRVNWRVIDGAARQKKMLRLRPDNEGKFMCPVDNCMHTGFRTSRGLRKHIDNRHTWFYYFDEKPVVKREEIVADPSMVRAKCQTHKVPAFSVTEGIGADFHKWLCAPLGGGKNEREATQVARRGMKFLLHAMGEDFIVDSKAWADYIDCAIGSTTTVINFMETVSSDWGMSSSGALNYIKSIIDLADFRISQGVPDAVLRAFSATEVYLRRGKANLQRRKAMDYSRNLDLESLIIKDSWCSLEEMESVIPFHAPRFKEVYNECARGSTQVSISDLAFASRFIASYLFLRVKCSRPRTFQFLTLEMIDQARSNGGYIDQTQFKTCAKYVFDTLILDDEVFKVLDMYTSVVRPRMQPQCNYLVISNTGRQYNSFTSAMTILVKQAIGKYVHPTRLRQIVETASSERLTTTEQEAVSADQKHNSHVAQRSYKKRLSREVAAKGKECMGKMLGQARDNATAELSQILVESAQNMEAIDETVLSRTRELLTPPSPRSLTPSKTTVDEVTDSEAVASDIPNIRCGSEEIVVTGVREGSKSGPEMVKNIDALPSWPTTTQPIVDVKEEQEKTTSSRVRKSTKKFSKAEDQYLLAGVKKYGIGHWEKIRCDPEYKFDTTRSRDSLRMRFGSAEVKRKARSAKLVQ